MAEFRLVTFHAEGRDRPGILVANRVADIDDAMAALGIDQLRAEAGSIASVLDRWDQWLPQLRNLAERLVELGDEEAGIYPLDSVQLRAPILYPRKVLCAGANYADHIREMQGTPPDPDADQPFCFMKAPTVCVVGPGAPVRVPRGTTKLDWEVELAVVIGKTARHVEVATARDHVAGYTILNDLSDRARTHREGIFSLDLLAGKSFDSSAPLGPCIVPKEFVPHPERLALRLFVNGELMQDSSTSHMIFGIDRLISYVSSILTLEPGDVISTGTPAGVGMGRGVFLKPGDVMIAEVEGIGRLENPVVVD